MLIAQALNSSSSHDDHSATSSSSGAVGHNEGSLSQTAKVTSDTPGSSAAMLLIDADVSGFTAPHDAGHDRTRGITSASE